MRKGSHRHRSLWYVGQVVEGKFTAVDIFDYYTWWEENKDLVAAEAEVCGFELR